MPPINDITGAADRSLKTGVPMKRQNGSPPVKFCIAARLFRSLPKSVRIKSLLRSSSVSFIAHPIFLVEHAGDEKAITYLMENLSIEWWMMLMGEWGQGMFRVYPNIGVHFFLNLLHNISASNLISPTVISSGTSHSCYCSLSIISLARRLPWSAALLNHFVASALSLMTPAPL